MTSAWAVLDADAVGARRWLVRTEVDRSEHLRQLRITRSETFESRDESAVPRLLMQSANSRSLVALRHYFR